MKDSQTSALYLRLCQRFTFQQVNDPQHTAKITKERFQNNSVTVLDWSSQSPDLNPTEHLWRDLKMAVHQRSPPNLIELERICKEEWPRIPKSRLKAKVQFILTGGRGRLPEVAPKGTCLPAQVILLSCCHGRQSNRKYSQLGCSETLLIISRGEPFDNTMIMIMNTAVCNIIVSMLFGHRFDYDDQKLHRLLKLVMELAMIAGSPMALVFTKQRKELDVNDQSSLIDSFLVKQKEEKPNPELYFHDENLTAVVTDLFAAGMETTSTTLRWGLLLMMKYPEIQKNVHKEIETVIGLAEPQMIHRKEMPYTDAVIHEIQRFANLVPTNVPRNSCNTITGHLSFEMTSTSGNLTTFILNIFWTLMEILSKMRPLYHFLLGREVVQERTWLKWNFSSSLQSCFRTSHSRLLPEQSWISMVPLASPHAPKNMRYVQFHIIKQNMSATASVKVSRCVVAGELSHRQLSPATNDQGKNFGIVETVFNDAKVPGNNKDYKVYVQQIKYTYRIKLQNIKTHIYGAQMKDKW
ncbi:unnamed protein product [Ranitomeya imitator]|uniref:Cytochrome P450 n=1 Tax=Ranitomeya imitator TaxID=111125 RepID=A0ABN9L2J1_9NEOB|nr:unnamed protein product [Ranitomeya imitator]